MGEKSIFSRPSFIRKKLYFLHHDITILLSSPGHR